MSDDKYCRDCIHWNKRAEQDGKLLKGDCLRVPQGMNNTIDGSQYWYDGWSFEDEIYDDVFHCFEGKEDK